MRRGLANNKRVYGRNFTHKEAQKRLDEVLPEFDSQTHNALSVNRTEIEYYRGRDSGIPCTCNKLPIDDKTFDSLDSSVPPFIPELEESDGSIGEGVEIKLRSSPIFGESEAERNSGDSIVDILGTDMEDREIDTALFDNSDGEVEFVDNALFGTNTDCGICYRKGVVPPFEKLRNSLSVLTSFSIEDAEGFYVDSTAVPNCMTRIEESGFIEFALLIPKYFQSARFSVRNNNINLITDRVFTDAGNPISLNYLRLNAGKEILIRIVAKEFTHVMFEFALSNSPIQANISGDNETLDYEKLKTLADFTVVVPNTIHDVSTGDIIVCRSRRLSLKVTNIERKRTATGKIFGWELNTRVIQQSESVNNINILNNIR